MMHGRKINGDRAFLESMIEHHKAALRMSRSYLSESNPAVRLASVAELAREIVKAQTSEIEDMNSMLDALKERESKR
jgi:uncharacterized protein (DUF305 family)